MPKPKSAAAAPPTRMQTLVSSDGNKPQGVPWHWTPIFCARHHFENLEKHGRADACGCFPVGPQVRALVSPAFETLFGGSRGPGKTEISRAILIRGNPTMPQGWFGGDPKCPHQAVRLLGITLQECKCGARFNPTNISYLNHPRYRSLVLRKNQVDLSDWVDRARDFFAPLGGEIRDRDRLIDFTSGAKVILGHMADADAYEKYMGQEFHRINLEEATQIPSELLYLRILGSCRSTFRCERKCKPELCQCGVLEPQAFLTANPGGVGHAHVRARFIDVAPPDTLYADPLTKKTRIFIPGRITDNPYLMRDEGYVNTLRMLPEAERRAWLDGDWNALAGQYFTNFRPKGPFAGEPPEANHIFKQGSRAIMPWWPRWIGCDWGYKHHTIVLGAVKDPNGQILVDEEQAFKEVGAVDIGHFIATKHLKHLEAMKKAGIRAHMNLWLSPDAWGKRNEELTIAEGLATGIARVLGPKSAYIAENWGHEQADWAGSAYSEAKLQETALITIKKAQNARIAGWQYVRELMRWRQIAQVKQETFDPEYATKLLHGDSDRYFAYMRSFQTRKSELLPKLLFSDSCEGIIRAIPLAIYQEGTEDVLKTDDVTDDFTDCCLVAGTMVATTDGDRPIEQIHPGEYVWTRSGPRRVAASGRTGVARPLVTAEMSDGSTITGTANHPVWNDLRGFVELGTLIAGDTVYTCRNANQCSSMESFTGDIQTRHSVSIGSTFHQAETSSPEGICSIARSGRAFTDLFQKASTFITSMATQLTTPLRIWPAYQSAIIGEVTATKSFASGREYRPRKSGIWLPLGTLAKKVEHGIRSMPWNLLPTVRKSSCSAIIVESPTKGSPESSAATTANQQPVANSGLTLWKRLVQSAASRLRQVNSTKTSSAPVTVRRLFNGGRGDVYNLTVEGAEEYFANGILVHNCRYLLHSQQVADNREPQNVFVQRHVEKYSLGRELDANDTYWMAMKARDDYKADQDKMKPFSLPSASARGSKYWKH